MLKIDNKRLKQAVFGAVEFSETDGALKMHRFTTKKREYFAQTENWILKPLKAPANANMLLDFYTDSKTLRFEAYCEAASRKNICYFDIYVNGTMVDNFGYEDAESKTVEYSIDLKPGTKRITIYLPCLYSAAITGVWLENDASFEPAKRDRKLFFIGDSITQGYITRYPSLTYSAIVMTGLNAESVNQGIGGNIFDADDLDDELPYQPDTIFVAYGTNDWILNLDYKKNAAKFLDKLTAIYSNAKIYLILPVWRAYAKERRIEKNLPVPFEQVHIDLEDLAQKYKNIKVVNGLDLIPHIRETLCTDGVHPNEFGFLFYGQELLKRILADEK